MELVSPQVSVLSRFKKNEVCKKGLNEDARWTRVYLRNYKKKLACHFIMNWCTKFEQDRYSRSKATAEIRFAQKTRWPPKIYFFVFLFYNQLVYQI